MSKLSRQVVATVLAQVGVRVSAETQADAAVNVDADIRTLRDALVSSQSILSLLYHRERSRLTTQSRADLYETLREVERAEELTRSE